MYCQVRKTTISPHKKMVRKTTIEVYRLPFNQSSNFIDALGMVRLKRRLNIGTHILKGYNYVHTALLFF